MLPMRWPVSYLFYMQMGLLPRVHVDVWGYSKVLLVLHHTANGKEKIYNGGG